jgi:acyl-CoA reductase-like NAD-dependent aldehyde dehydrogenase
MELDDILLNFRAIKVGDPSAPDTWMGALVSKEHAAKVTGYIQRAAEGGATIQCGHGVDKGVDESNGFHMKVRYDSVKLQCYKIVAGILCTPHNHHQR